MKADLQARRQHAADQHDAALERWPDQGPQFADALRGVVAELEAVAAQMPGWVHASVEWARTWRWLGDARSDLGQATDDRDVLRAAWDAYDRADTLIGDAFDPVERGKLLANWGNLSFRMAGTDDRALMGRALRQYQQARELFAANQPSLAAQVDRRIADLRKLIQVFDLRAQLAAVEPPDPKTATPDQVQAFGKQVEQAGASLSTLTDEAPGSDRPEIAMFRALRDRAEADIAAGKVTPERATTLRQILDELGTLVASQGEDIETMMQNRARLMPLMLRVRELLAPKAGGDPTTRGAKVVPRVAKLEQAIGTLAMRVGAGEETRRLTQELFVRAGRARTQLEGASENDASVLAIERDTVRPLASDARRLARLNNLTVAWPDFRTGPVYPSLSTVAWSGPAWLEAPLAAACHARGLDAQGVVHGDEAARVRWQQLREAGVGVFAFDDAHRDTRAAVAYELGLARSVGLPVVVLCTPGTAVPFDVGVRTVRVDPANPDAAEIGDAIDAALYGMAAEPPPSDGIVATAREMIHRYGDSPVPGVAVVLRDLRKKLATPDAPAIEATLSGIWVQGQTDRPQFLVPAWPPAYPGHDGQRLFHVMPFARAYDRVRDAVAELLGGTTVTYRRHDQVDDERILSSLWTEIGEATHVLVDLTGMNDNVLMELGFAHALGKATLLVAQAADDPGRRALLGAMPETLRERRVHFYGDDLRELVRQVGRFVRISEAYTGAAEKRVAPTVAAPAPKATAPAPKQPAPAPKKPVPAPPAPVPKVPTRHGLARIRSQFAGALARDQRDQGLRTVLSQGSRMHGVMLTAAQLGGLVEFVRGYVASVPDMLDAAWTLAVQQGSAAMLDPILTQVEAYCDNPNDVFPDHLGLVGVLDDAYLARQVLLGVAARSRGALPAVQQADVVIRQQIIGEPFGTQLDFMVMAILQGPAVLGALQQFSTLGAPATWSNAIDDYELDRLVDTKLGAMGVV